MDKENMPAADAAQYELAFHVLPTVAEGEVADVVTSLKSAVEAAGGTITTEEAPKRFDLAYEVIKYLEGRNRKFTSAYFGWVRFTLEPSKLEEVMETVEGTNQLLRHLLIRLTKMEEADPFMFHEALEESQVATDEDEAEVKEEKKDEKAEEAKTEVVKDGKDAAEEVK
jgi:ribosomal protein S6